MPLRRRLKSLVTVNGVVIPPAVIAQEARNVEAASLTEAWREAARSLVVRELLLQKARSLGIVAKPALLSSGGRETEEAALVRAVIEREVASPAPDEAACRRFYADNEELFRLPDAAAVAEADPMALACRLALELRAIATEKPELFAELQGVHPVCATSKPDGGSEAGTGAAALRERAPSHAPPVASAGAGRAGLSGPCDTVPREHFIRLDRVLPGTVIPYDLVAGRIARTLGAIGRRKAVARYVARLAAEAQISGVRLSKGAGEQDE